MTESIAHGIAPLAAITLFLDAGPSISLKGVHAVTTSLAHFRGSRSNKKLLGESPLQIQLRERGGPRFKRTERGVVT